MSFDSVDFTFEVIVENEDVFLTKDVFFLFFVVLDEARQGVEACIFFCPTYDVAGFFDVVSVFLEFFGKDFFRDEFCGAAETVYGFDVYAVLFCECLIENDSFSCFVLIGDQED